MKTVTNIAAYKFANISHLKELREQLTQRCRWWALKGTILLSTEGINLFVAGPSREIDLLLAELRAIPGLEQLEPKFSESEEQPFHRMLVKIKKEIIAFGVEGIDPVSKPAPKLPARELKKWLDEGRPLVLLDTRNDYEIQLGTFRNALTLDIDHFRQFPDAVRQLPDEMKQQPIVMFCTGGIRCEKAGPFMQREGFENIHQLDGGILKYFEECGGDHYDGECFVFDQRVGVDPDLSESNSKQCFACQSPLAEADQSDARFVEGKSCPYCFIANENRSEQILAERHQAIRQVSVPLPGSMPYDNIRPLNVPLHCDGMPLVEFLCSILGQVSREEWEQACAAGRIRRRLNKSGSNRNEESESVAANPDEIVRAGMRFLHLTPNESEPDVCVDIRIVYEDESIIVVNKPAPLPMHPSGRYCRNTLQYILHQVYAPQSPRPAHRLDANTTGLVIFARTRHFAKRLQRQFEPDREVGVNKQYLTRVHGHPRENVFSCDLPISTEAGPLGSRDIDIEYGLPARTDFVVLKRFGDGTSLLKVIPLTGRTNQIRLHLWALGNSICGDATYRPGQEIGETQTLSVGDPPLCLHAQRIEFDHPLSGERLTFETDPPSWAEM